MAMYIFQKNDLKYQLWSEALAEKGIETLAVAGSPLSAPVLLIGKLAKRVKIDGYVFRYLNDYPSFWKTVARAFSEICVIGLVKLVGGRIFWVAHNVDRESSSHQPRLTRFRRFIVAKCAHTVFVTDPLLIAHAKRHLPAARTVQWTCFGGPPKRAANEGTMRVHDAICRIRQSLQQRFPGKKVYIGLCVCAASEKCVHLLSICDFVERCSTDSVITGMVVVSDVSSIDNVRFRQARERMLSHTHVVLLDEAIQVRETYLAGGVDFFYRALDDLSVSYTVYVAAAVGKPLIVEAGTFLAEMVQHYRLGGVVPSDTDALNGIWLAHQMRVWEPHQAEAFLRARSWTKAAEQLSVEMSGFSRESANGHA